MHSKANDVLGIAPYGEALKVAVEKSFETAQTFLYDLCRPAAAEVGLLMRDHVRIWRATNLAKISNKARDLISVTEEGVNLRSPPRIVHEVVENGSWCEDEQLQQMWAGLLATSCTPDGKDESNLLFIDILKRLSSAEAKLIDYVCKETEVKPNKNGILFASPVDISIADIGVLTGWSDKTLAQAHLGHLISLGLLKAQPQVSFGGKMYIPWIQSEQLALQFYVRCNGSMKSPDNFFSGTS